MGDRGALGDMKERAMLNKHEDAAADYRRHVFKTGDPIPRARVVPDARCVVDGVDSR